MLSPSPIRLYSSDSVQRLDKGNLWFIIKQKIHAGATGFHFLTFTILGREGEERGRRHFGAQL